MPNLQDYSITPNGVATTAGNQAVITGTLLDDDNETVIAEFQGGTALHWPEVIGDLSAADREAMLAEVAPKLINARAGRGYV